MRRAAKTGGVQFEVRTGRPNDAIISSGGVVCVYFDPFVVTGTPELLQVVQGTAGVAMVPTGCKSVGTVGSRVGVRHLGILVPVPVLVLFSFSLFDFRRRW